MLSKLRNRAQSEKGFTLIELLVVILIIGILAAIALPAFLAQRGKAQDTEAKSAARTAQTAMETWYTDEQDYTAADDGAAQGHRACAQSGVAAVDPGRPDACLADTLHSHGHSRRPATTSRSRRRLTVASPAPATRRWQGRLPDGRRCTRATAAGSANFGGILSPLNPPRRAPGLGLVWFVKGRGY